MTASLYAVPDALIDAELARRRYLADPIAWAVERLGDTLWSAQRRILEAVRDHRRVAVQSCHAVGKSRIASVVASWWIDTALPGDGFVVTTAPTAPQVRAILWREIGRAHVRGKLPGRVNQTEWWLTMPAGNEELVAFGRKPDEYDPAAFQGIHARRVLVILDEACGVPAPLWDAADSLIANDASKLLVVGNPDDPSTEFASVCKPGSGWHVIQVGAFDTPNFTGEPVPPSLAALLIGRTYVDEKRHKWAPAWGWTEDGSRCIPPVGAGPDDTNPLWQSKVLGQFPQSGTGGLIPIAWIRAAMARDLATDGPNELGVDVGGGGDSSVVAHRRGGVVRILREDTNPDTMQTCGHVIQDLRTTGATAAKIDMIGIGKGVVDRGRELEQPFRGINVGETARDAEHFVNRRAELWWAMRDRFQAGDIDLDPDDEDTAAELCSLRYKATSRGQIQIESKDDAKRRGVPSPNRADAIMLAFATEGRKGTPDVWMG